MVSAKKGQGCKDLIDFLQTTIPVSPFLYNKDQLTDYLKEYFHRKSQEKNFLIILIPNYLITSMLKLSFGKKQKNQLQFIKILMYQNIIIKELLLVKMVKI